MSIRIEDPCTENWNRMHPTEQGAFCSKCQKEVIDFSVMNKNQIQQELLKRSRERVCGRITPNQLLELNADYEEFYFRNKQSFQVAFLYSLMIAFGLTLFSCSNEEQASIIGEMQLIDIHKDDVQNYDDDMVLGEIEAVESMDLLDLTIENRNMNTKELSVGWIDTIEKQRSIEIRETEVFETMGMVRMDIDYLDYLEEKITPLETYKNPEILEENTLTIEKFDAIAWPNPTQGISNIKLDLKWSQQTEVSVYDLMGRKLFQLQDGKLPSGSHEFQFDLSEQPKGSYIVVINTPSFKKSLQIAKM